MWMPGEVADDPDRAEVPDLAGELLRGEPRDRVRAGRVERDVAEVEQARVADDDVQADRHHHEDEHVDARRRRPATPPKTGIVNILSA